MREEKNGMILLKRIGLLVAYAIPSAIVSLTFMGFPESLNGIYEPMAGLMSWGAVAFIFNPFLLLLLGLDESVTSGDGLFSIFFLFVVFMLYLLCLLLLNTRMARSPRPRLRYLPLAVHASGGFALMVVSQFFPEVERASVGELVVSIFLFAIFFSLAWLYLCIDWELAKTAVKRPARIP
jgi:hypothetical protein